MTTQVGDVMDFLGALGLEYSWSQSYGEEASPLSPQRGLLRRAVAFFPQNDVPSIAHPEPD